MEKKIKLVFYGAGAFAPPVLDALRHDDGIELLSVVTQPDKPAGRKAVLTPTPLGKWCQAEGIDFERVQSVNAPEYLETLRALQPDLAVVVSFGQLLKEEMLMLPRLGCLNVHASLLPKYRGASPIVSAVLDGESRTGVSFMRMDKGLDTGPVYQRLEMEINDDITAPELENELARLAGSQIGDCIRALASGTVQAQEQDHAAATLSRKIRKHHASIDWAQDAAALSRKIRAFYPWPSAVFMFPRGERTIAVKISAGKAISEGDASRKPGTVLAVTPQGITIACGSGALLLEKVIPEGKKEMRAVDFAHGFRLEPGVICLNGPGIPAM